jgi:hypothetical protein
MPPWRGRRQGSAAPTLSAGARPPPRSAGGAGRRDDDAIPLR